MNLYTRTVLEYSARFRASLEALERALPSILRAEKIAEVITFAHFPCKAHYIEHRGVVLIAAEEIDLESDSHQLRQTLAQFHSDLVKSGDNWLILDQENRQIAPSITIQLEGTQA